MKLVIFGDYHYVSDNYYGDNSYVFNYSDTFVKNKRQYHKYIIHEIFKEDADLYISLGDLSNNSMEDELKDFYQFVECTGKMNKFIHVFGNHDLYNHTAEELKKMLNQNYNYSIENENIKLIFLKTAMDLMPEDWSGFVSEDDINWLQKEIKDAKDKKLFVFGHHPIYNTTTASNTFRASISEDIDIWKALNECKNNGTYIAGHTHFDSIETLNNWNFINLGAVLDKPRYSTLEILENDVKFKTHFIEISEEFEKIRLEIGTNMPYFTLRPIGVGTKANLEVDL